MRALDSHALQMFVAVALCLNFRQAAEQLHMTQPPLSRAIKLLEQRLGVRLFERNTHGVALTPAAVQLLPAARRILALLGDAERTLLAWQAAPASLRLGLPTAFEGGMFRAFAETLSEALAPIRLELAFQPSPTLVREVRAGRLDAAVIALPTRTFELPVLALGRQPTLVALASRHPLARRRSLSLHDLREQPVYWFERARQPAFFDHCHAIFRRHDFAPAFLREPHDHHVLLSDVAAGKGMALLPESFRALKLAGVAYRQLAEGEELAVGTGLIVGAAGHPALPLLRRLALGRLG